MLEPLFNKVIVALIEDKTEMTLKSGIILPAGIRAVPKPQTEGHVVSLGSGGVTKTGNVLPMTVKPGDRVILEPKQGAAVAICGKEYIIIPEDNILAIIKEE
jgi:chaperonin GroES